MRRALVSLVAAVFFSGIAVPASSQTATDTKAQKSRAPQPITLSREQLREQLNENVLFLMGGQLGAAYIQLAHDIAVVINDGANLRVLPVVGEAAVQNVKDLLFLRGVDLALTTIQVLNHLKATGEAGPNLERQITYIAPLFHDTVQILTRNDIESIEDLKGKKVSFNNTGSATALFAPQIFKALGIDVQVFNMPQADAIQKLRANEIDATVCACPMPLPAFASLKPDSGLRLLPVPLNEAYQESYLPAAIGHDEYPALVPKDEKVESIATSTLLISFNWPKGSVRYNRTAKFVEAFFSKFGEFQKPPRHPLWKSTNIAASMPGWTRFPAAQEWLDRERVNQASAFQMSFRQFAAERASRQPQAEPVDNDRLFREFLDWMGQGKRRN
jgi:TRAP transporter TAXI family solute receptor